MTAVEYYIYQQYSNGEPEQHNQGQRAAFPSAESRPGHRELKVRS